MQHKLCYKGNLAYNTLEELHFRHSSHTVFYVIIYIEKVYQTQNVFYIMNIFLKYSILNLFIKLAKIISQVFSNEIT